MNHLEKNLMPYLFLFLAVSFWSGNFIVARAIQYSIPPVSLSFWRWSVALLILLPFCVGSLFRQRKLIRKHWKLLVLLGILGVTNFSTFIYLALHSTTVTNTVLIHAVNPVVIVIISMIGFKDRITWLQAAGIGISLTGLGWIVIQGNPAALMTLQFSRGDLWTLAATFSWALYTALLRRYPHSLDPTTFLTLLIIIGLIFLLPLYLWELSTKHIIKLGLTTIGSTLYLGIFASILAYIFWNKGVNMIGANRAGVFIYLIPVMSILLAFLLFGERFKSYHLPGMFLIIIGIFFTTRSSKP